MSNLNTEQNSEAKKPEGISVLHGVLIPPKIRIYGEFKHYYYENGYYGDKYNDYLELNYEEALLLVERGRLVVHGEENEKIAIEELKPEMIIDYIENLPIFDAKKLTQFITSKQDNFWGRYLVYKDLRSRGYVVRAGYGPKEPYRRYPRGTKAEKSQSNVLVYPFVEGKTLELFELEQIVDLAHANRKTLILGIVDRSGDVTYYKTSELELKENKEQYRWQDEIKPTKTLLEKEIEEKSERITQTQNDENNKTTKEDDFENKSENAAVN